MYLYRSASIYKANSNIPFEKFGIKFFSTAYKSFSKMDHIFGHKSSLGKFNKCKNLSTFFSYHNDRRIKIKNRKDL